MKKYATPLLLSLSLLAFVRPALPAHPTAFQFYVSFKGAKQGQIKGQAAGKGGREKDGWFLVNSFDFGAETKVATKPGNAKGTATQKPIVITKEVDGASPKLLNAHVNSEAFETVVIQTVERPQTGAGEKVTETVTLTNAQIIEYKTDQHIETVSFIYDQILRKK